MGLLYFILISIVYLLINYFIRKISGEQPKQYTEEWEEVPTLEEKRKEESIDECGEIDDDFEKEFEEEQEETVSPEKKPFDLKEYVEHEKSLEGPSLEYPAPEKVSLEQDIPDQTDIEPVSQKKKTPDLKKELQDEYSDYYIPPDAHTKDSYSISETVSEDFPLEPEDLEQAIIMK